MSEPSENFKAVQVSFHRNGVGGEGFHAVIFEIDYQTCPECGDEWGWTSINAENVRTVSCFKKHAGPPNTTRRRMVASVFESRGHVAIYAIDGLADPKIGVTFGENSWRGDRYEDELREAIKNMKSSGSVKAGPFAIVNTING